MKKIKVGLLGLTSTSINKGCEALTYSFIEMLKQYTDYMFEFYFVEKFSFIEFRSNKLFSRLKKENNKFKDNGVNISHIFYRPFHNSILFSNNIRKLDICFDFTQGDSFTDIYGEERFDEWTKVKEEVMKRNVPLVLGSQTIGPFCKKTNEKRAAKVLNKCNAVFTRDIDSLDYVKMISNASPILTTDIAFFLPFNNKINDVNKIGINPSGLLWNGGYTEDNQFGLLIDYKEFCEKIVSYAIKKGFEVHLIGHVMSENLEIKDNDYTAIKELHRLFPETIVAPVFQTPMEAKNYISSMSAFIGARMHATIAAISAGIPVLAFSYSRKFEGLFKTLEYDYIIHGKNDNFDCAYDKFKNFLDNIPKVKQEILKSNKIISEMKNDMMKSYYDIINNIIELHKR